MLTGIYKRLWLVCVPLTGYAIGAYFDYRETHRMTMFRDKSMLYGRELKAGEAPSWP